MSDRFASSGATVFEQLRRVRISARGVLSEGGAGSPNLNLKLRDDARLAAQHGFGSASAQRVFRAAKLGSGTFYKLFEDREGRL